MHHSASAKIIIPSLFIGILFILPFSLTRAETLPTSNNQTSPLIQINEFLPNPIGNDVAEWIELKNQEPFDVVLDGWKIENKKSKSYIFSKQTISANGLLVITRGQSKLILNNNTDMVRLIDPHGVIKESVHYENALEGKSFAKIGSEWHGVTTPTPGKENGDDTQTVIEQSTPPPAETEKIIEADIKDLKKFNDNTALTLHGIVTAPFGILGKNTLSIENEEGTHAIFVRTNTGLLPTLQPGDNIRVRGRLKKRDGKVWIASRTTGIHFLSHSTLNYSERIPSEIKEKDIGVAVLMKGVISSHGSHWITLADTQLHHEIKVLLSKDTSTKTMNDGAHVTVKGVVRYQKDGPEILVMDKKDITFQPTQEKNTVKNEQVPSKKTENQNNSTPRQPVILAGQDDHTLFTIILTALTVAALIIGYLIWKKKRDTEIMESDL